MKDKENINKIIIIGAGTTTHNLIEYMKKLERRFSDTFFLCLDNNSLLWGTRLDGVVVSPVDEIQKYPDADIVISSIYEGDIRKQLEKMNINNFIMNYVDYKRMIFVDYQTKKYNAMHHDIKKRRKEKIKELTVYTVIFDKYDLLREIIYPDNNIRYICFTDDKTLHSDTWEIRQIDRKFSDPVIESRWYKMMPHLFIDTKYSLYIDATVQFKKSPLEFMNQYFDKGDMLFIPHEARDCIYKEMAVCILENKEFLHRLVRQVDKYSESNCPEHSGLFWGGIIGRSHFEKEIIEFNNEWWEHFKQYSRRDQISLGYLIWKNDMEISLANINLCNNSWFNVDERHESERKRL